MLTETSVMIESKPYENRQAGTLIPNSSPT
jgi:hypothetical protein